MESTVKLYSLPVASPKALIVTFIMVVGNIVLPALCHLIPQGGLILLPIYFFTLLGAYKYGLRVGILIGILSPLVNHLLTGMPPAAMLPAILVKSILIAFAASYVARKYRRVSIILLAVIVIFYQVVGTGFEWIHTGSLFTAIQDFRLAVPGMLLQITGVYGILKLMARYGH